MGNYLSQHHRGAQFLCNLMLLLLLLAFFLISFSGSLSQMANVVWGSKRFCCDVDRVVSFCTLGKWSLFPISQLMLLNLQSLKLMFPCCFVSCYYVMHDLHPALLACTSPTLLSNLIPWFKLMTLIFMGLLGNGADLSLEIMPITLLSTDGYSLSN